MKLKDIISNSIYCTIGYCDEKHLETLEQYIEQNRFLLEKFNKIYIAYNHDGKTPVSKAFEIWSKILKQNRIGGTELSINRGQTYGTMDLDNECINYCKDHFNGKYIWKTSIDIVFFPQILEKEIPEVDFYYMNGLGIGGLENYDKKYKFPQTNFYIIKNGIDYLNDEKEIDKVYELQQQNPNKRPWELKQNFQSESLLYNCVVRNKLKTHNLMSEKGWKDLIDVVKHYSIVDPSHKNLIIDDVGVCHLHFINQPSYTVSDLRKTF